ncbi:MAG: DHA2 family efflux MFS transporter permease subunit [Hyphomicrobium sp.]
MDASAWSIAAVRDAILKGREPPPVASLAQLPSYRWLVVGVVSIGAFMGQVDASIAQLLLPSLERTFGATLSGVSWVAVAYLLTMAALMPIFGRLADIFGHKLLYVAGFVVFVVGSALCGFAPDLPILIASRILQAIGGALLSANSVAIVVSAAGPGERGRAVGVQAAAQAVGLSAGPVIGGVLLNTLGWQWVFWINVPFGIVGAIAGWFILPKTMNLSKESKDKSFDLRGALLLGPMLTAFMLVLNEGHAWGVTSPAYIVAAIAGLALLFFFIKAERRAEAPLLNPRLFKQLAFTAANAGSLMSYALLFGIMLLMPFVFENGYHDTPLQAGLRLAIIPIAISLVAPISGLLFDRFGPRLPTLTGMLICAAALIVLFFTLGEARADLLGVMIALGIFGVGQGLFTAANNTAIMAAAPADLTGEAGGLLNVTRAFGISLGIASASLVLSLQLEAIGDATGSTFHASPGDLLAASRVVVLCLIVFAAAAAAASVVGTQGMGREEK